MRAVLLNGIEGRNPFDEISKNPNVLGITPRSGDSETSATLYYLRTDELLEMSLRYQVDCISRDFGDRCWYIAIYSGLNTSILCVRFDYWTYQDKFYDYLRSRDFRDRMREIQKLPYNEQDSATGALLKKYIEDNPMTQRERDEVEAKYRLEEKTHITLDPNDPLYYEKIKAKINELAETA